GDFPANAEGSAGTEAESEAGSEDEIPTELGRSRELRPNWTDFLKPESAFSAS
ncbi:hypothetical protein AYX13_07122, partial [Cryptococcus neoformans]